MKILLVAINAKYIHSNLAVYCLRSMLPLEASIEIKEYTINQPLEKILSSLYKEKPDVLFFSCYIWNISFVEQLVEELSALMPQLPLWVGGPEVSYNPYQSIERMQGLKGILCGEGEETFAELAAYYSACACMEKKQELFEILGLVYRENGQVHVTKSRGGFDFQYMPFPYKIFFEEKEIFQNRILYYESSRGCPFSCSYCLSSVDKKLRFRDTGLIDQELTWFLNHRVAQVKFVDRTFNSNKKHAMHIWRFIREYDNLVTNFHFEIAADLLDEEMLTFLASMRPGQIQLEIGVQSINEKTLEEVNRKMNVERLFNAVTFLLKQGNIHLHLDLIAGLPFEDEQSFKKSFDFVYVMHPHQLQLGFLKVLKGTKMEENSEDYDILASKQPPFEVRATRWLDYNVILRLKAVEEVLEQYYNSGQFKYAIRFLEHFFTSSFSLYEELACFFEKKNRFSVAHSRIRKYEYLLEFAEERLKEERVYAAFLELLTIDFYLRENAKSRPAFAPSCEAYRDCYRKFLSGNAKQMGFSNQLHIEHVSINFEETIKQGKVIEKPSFLLFDYSEKTALFQEAKLTILSEGLGS